MIPPFDHRGYLPPGIHSATLDEIDARFGQESELRRIEMESLRWLAALAGRAGVLRVVINGSFVTDAYEPNDVDCVQLLAADFPRDAAAEAELVNGLPFLDISLVHQEGWDEMVEKVFSMDRRRNVKGMIEVERWI